MLAFLQIYNYWWIFAVGVMHDNMREGHGFDLFFAKHVNHRKWRLSGALYQTIVEETLQTCLVHSVDQFLAGLSYTQYSSVWAKRGRIECHEIYKIATKVRKDAILRGGRTGMSLRVDISLGLCWTPWCGEEQCHEMLSWWDKCQKQTLLSKEYRWNSRVNIEKDTASWHYYPWMKIVFESIFQYAVLMGKKWHNGLLSVM